MGSRGLAFRGFRLAVWGGSLGASGALLGWSQMEGIQRDFPYCCKKVGSLDNSLLVKRNTLKSS